MKIEHIIDQQRIDKSVLNQAIYYKGEFYTYFDSGLTRHVFVNADKTKVIKLLVEKNNVEFNEKEIKIYKNASKYERNEMAKTKTAYDGFVVEQEFCNPIKWDERELTIEQMLFAAACRQEVGWTIDGQLVCFDLDEYKKY